MDKTLPFDGYEWVDLSHTLEEDIPAWPTHARFGKSPLRVDYAAGDVARHYGLTLSEHTGTHMDAPLHFIPEGPAHYGTDEIPLDRLAGRAATIDATDLGAGDLFGVGRIEAWEEEHGHIEAGDRVLIRYGWDRRWTTGPEGRRFLEDWPGLSGGAAEYLVGKGVSLVGCDTLAMDAAVSTENPAHHALLGNEVYIVENLKNLDRLPPFCLLPRVTAEDKGGSGSPVRAVALVAALIAARLDGRSKIVHQGRSLRKGGSMKGIVWHGPEEMSVEEVPEPDVGPGTVVVRPTAAGICGSEIEGYLGRMGNRTPPLVMGHEFAGTVTEVGEGVDEDLLGRLVAVNPLSSDGTCRLCRGGLTNLCPNRRLVGIHSPGGFAEYTLAPAENVYPLPEGVEARTGALAEPLANGVHAARLGLAGGPRGARRRDRGRHHRPDVPAGRRPRRHPRGLTSSSPCEARREQALALGASAVYASGEEAREALEGPTEGLGADLVIDAVGAEVTRRMALEICCGPADGSCTSGCTTTTPRSGSTMSCGASSTCRARTPTRPRTTSRRSSGSSRARPVSGSCRPSCRWRRGRGRSPSSSRVRRRR